MTGIFFLNIQQNQQLKKIYETLFFKNRNGF
jgi:hypothetical protein